MSQITLTWALPPVSNRQRPIKHVLVEGRIQQDPALPWSPINTVLADDPQTLQIDNPLPGLWEFRWTVVDVDDRVGAPYVKAASTEIAFDNPGQVESVVIEVT